MQAQLQLLEVGRIYSRKPYAEEADEGQMRKERSRGNEEARDYALVHGSPL